jgi:hypothetical protein
MLLVFSDLCNESEYIRREVTVAGESHKIIIPFRIEDAQPRRGLRVRLSDLHWIDGFAARERAIDELAHHLASQEPATQRRQRPGRDQRHHERGGEEGPPPELQRKQRSFKPVTIGLAAAALVILAMLGLMLNGALRSSTRETALKPGATVQPTPQPVAPKPVEPSLPQPASAAPLPAPMPQTQQPPKSTVVPVPALIELPPHSHYYEREIIESYIESTTKQRCVRVFDTIIIRFGNVADPDKTNKPGYHLYCERSPNDWYFRW